MTAALNAARNALANQHYDACAILPYRDQLEANQADAMTLVLLSGLRQLIEDHDLACRLVAELRESRSAGLAELVSPDDLILSDSVTASLLAQLVERPSMDCVLADLLDYRGAALFVHPTDRWDLLAGQRTISFDDVRREVIAGGELPIGVRVNGQIDIEPFGKLWERADLTGIIVLGAGVDWHESSCNVHLSDLR